MWEENARLSTKYHITEWRTFKMRFETVNKTVKSEHVSENLLRGMIRHAPATTPAIGFTSTWTSCWRCSTSPPQDGTARPTEHDGNKKSRPVLAHWKRRAVEDRIGGHIFISIVPCPPQKDKRGQRIKHNGV